MQYDLKWVRVEEFKSGVREGQKKPMPVSK